MREPKRLIELATAALPNGAVLSREESQALVQKIVKLSKADAISVGIGGGYSTNVRFADNQMSTSGGIVDFNVFVQSSFGPKHAVVTTNDVSDASLKRVVEQSEALAKLAPDDPEAMPELPPQEYKDVAYQMRTPDFWNAMDMIGGKSSYELWGSFFDGKGQPGQSNAVSHGSVPARFRQINVINTGRKA